MNMQVGARTETETRNKTVTRRYFEDIWSRRDMTALEELVAPAVTGHVNDETLHGRDALRERVHSLYTIYSQPRFVVEDQVAEGDKVAVRWTFCGTHTGEYTGVPLTHKEVEATGTHIFCLADGQIVEMWVHSDDLGELQQLGVISMPS